ncbi:MAG: cobyrinate a,c-diamide synthase [Myxococcota bacterium]|jgi:cobyrinic acid a,c-diamide synthase|nr:cobyrinate a,c-diamide synthase [Myxococcota bacterium]
MGGDRVGRNVTEQYPRLVVAGPGGDSGKTLVSLGLCLAWRDDGFPVHAFKKGPDYIDTAWLSWAAGVPARNLDSYLMGFDGIRRAFASTADPTGPNLIEGNRGIFDGAGPAGTHSTAELAKALDAPVLLVLGVAKTTRTAAAIARGLTTFDPGLRFAGIVVNRIAGQRHETAVRRAIEDHCDVPVVGAIPALRGDDPLPGRHLGLVAVQEREGLDSVRARLVAAIRGAVDLERLRTLASEVDPPAPVAPDSPVAAGGTPVRIGVLRDTAFHFYYPENLEALAAQGVELVPLSALEARGLPALDGLYAGGGFPETHAGALSANVSLRAAVREAAAAGLPIYAECGGLMYLARSIRVRGRDFPMAGVLPIRLAVEDRPQGHGYVEVEVDADNPVFPTGTVLRGHEFHYSRVIEGGGDVRTAFAMRRGTGCVSGRDGIVSRNVLASYIHLHARGVPQWAPGFVATARAYAQERDRKIEPRRSHEAGSGK